MGEDLYLHSKVISHRSSHCLYTSFRCPGVFPRDVCRVLALSFESSLIL